MKIHRLITLLAAALLCAASQQSSAAADVVADISSFAPREPFVILRQIELNVSIKQYEKVLMELHEASLQSEIGPTETGLTDEQQKQWMVRSERKLKYLENTAAVLRKRIHDYVAEANEMARTFEKDRAPEKAEHQSVPVRPSVQNPG